MIPDVTIVDNGLGVADVMVNGDLVGCLDNLATDEDQWDALCWLYEEFGQHNRSSLSEWQQIIERWVNGGGGSVALAHGIRAADLARRRRPRRRDRLA